MRPCAAHLAMHHPTDDGQVQCGVCGCVATPPKQPRFKCKKCGKLLRAVYLESARRVILPIHQRMADERKALSRAHEKERKAMKREIATKARYVKALKDDVVTRLHRVRRAQEKEAGDAMKKMGKEAASSSSASAAALPALPRRDSPPPLPSGIKPDSFFSDDGDDGVHGGVPGLSDSSSDDDSGGGHGVGIGAGASNGGGAGVSGSSSGTRSSSRGLGRSAGEQKEATAVEQEWAAIIKAQETIREHEADLDELKKEHNLPAADGYRHRIVAGDVSIGMRDLHLEHMEGELALQLEAAGPEGQPQLRVELGPATGGAPGAPKRGGFVVHVRVEQLRIVGEKGSLIPSLKYTDLALQLEIKLAIDLVYDIKRGAWQNRRSCRFEVVRMESHTSQRKGGGLPRRLIKWLGNLVLPRVIQRVVVNQIPPELGVRLCVDDGGGEERPRHRER